MGLNKEKERKDEKSLEGLLRDHVQSEFVSVAEFKETGAICSFNARLRVQISVHVSESFVLLNVPDV